MHKKNILLEICVFNITDMVTAVASGADRIELCASYFEGGITPTCTDHRCHETIALKIL